MITGFVCCLCPSNQFVVTKKIYSFSLVKNYKIAIAIFATILTFS